MDSGGQTTRSLRVFLVEFLCNDLALVDGAGDTPPGNVLQRAVALSVDSEACVVLTLDQPVPSFVTVHAPWLHREWLVQIVFMARLLV